MSTTKKLNNITAKQIAERGVQALSNKPNSSSRYGAGGLSSEQLKLWFDRLATFLAEKINEIQDVISGGEAAAYIRLLLDDYGIENLDELVTSFIDGSFAERILMVSPSATAEEKVAIQTVINSFAQTLAIQNENLLALIAGSISDITVEVNKITNVICLKGYTPKGEAKFARTIELDTDFSDVGLNVIDGMLCATFEEET